MSDNSKEEETFEESITDYEDLTPNESLGDLQNNRKQYKRNTDIKNV
jgi:hypothetical protein